MGIRGVLSFVSLLVFSLSFNWATAEDSLRQPDQGPRRQRVAIIGGGGAGVTTAWLLDPDYDVTLYEKEDRLGGHANTLSVQLNGKTYPIDGGFEFINETGFPYFFRLLKILGVKLNQFELTSSIYSTAHSRSLVLTPIRKEGVAWDSVLNPKNLIDLLRLKTFFQKAQEFVSTGPENFSKKEITLDTFFNQIGLNTTFKNNLLLPLLAASWGASGDEMKSWSAETILRTLLPQTEKFSAPQWSEIEGGTSHYIEVARSQLKNSAVMLSSTISSITYDETSQSYTVSTPNGEAHFDHLVLATPPQAVQGILKNVMIPEVASLSSTLHEVESFESNLALHGDVRFMPKRKDHWSVVNIHAPANGSQSALTVYKKWQSEPNTPIFKSWIFEGDPKPEPLYATAHYWHIKLDQKYLNAQKAVAEFQGKYHLWFAGAHTLGARHENAIVSALFIAKQLAPNSERVKLLED